MSVLGGELVSLAAEGGKREPLVASKDTLLGQHVVTYGQLCRAGPGAPDRPLGSPLGWGRLPESHDELARPLTRL